MIARFKKSLSMARSVFQHIRSVFVRWRIFKVYICPIIEWYLPVIMTKHKTAGSKQNSIESFQHQMLSLVSGACSRSNATKLGRIMAEMPIELKLGKLADRMRDYVPRNEYHLIYGNQTMRDAIERHTRANGTTTFRMWAGVRRKDFGDMLTRRAYEFNHNDDRELYDKKSDKKLIFTEKEVKTWVKNNNRNIRLIARRRFLGLMD